MFVPHNKGATDGVVRGPPSGTLWQGLLRDIESARLLDELFEPLDRRGIDRRAALSYPR